MNKNDLLNIVSEDAGLTKKTVSNTLESIGRAVTNALAAGESVALPGIGKFTPKTREARQGRNPQTGETINLPAKTTAKFTATKTLTESLN